MRKSTPISRARAATAAGLTTAAVGAALLVYPAAAFAASTVTPPIAAPLSNVVITEDSATFTATVSRVVLQAAPATCPATIPTVVANQIVAATTVGTSTTTAVTITLPAFAVAGNNGQARRYIACVYGATGSDNRQGSANGYPILVGVPPTASPASGTTGGGNTVTITGGTDGAIFTGVSTIGAVFSTTACPATYGTPAAGTAVTASKVNDSAATVVVPSGVVSTSAALAPYSVCLYSGAAGASALISSVQYGVSQLSLSQTTGPYQGLNGLNLTSPNQFLAGIDTPGVLFTSALTCPNVYSESDTTYSAGVTPSQKYVAAANVRKLMNTRLAVTVPALLVTPPASTLGFNVCVYNGNTPTSSPLISTAGYTVTTVHTSTRVTPNAGPALGGSKIIVTGTAFPTTPGALSATLGGAPLDDVTPISSTAFSATTPQHAPGNNVALVVTSAAGQHILQNAYSYYSALKVAPNTAPNTRAVDVVVNGIGFQNALWSNTVTTGSHIFLVRGLYSGSANGSDRANPAMADCGNVLVLSDTELICKLDLTRRLNATGTAVAAAPAPIAAATLTIATTVGSRVIVGTFTRAQVGLTIEETGHASVPAGTTIVDVVDGTHAVMSATATATTGNISGQLLPPLVRSLTVTTTGTTNALAGTGFTQADVGRYIITGDVTAGQTIATVTNATTATLSGVASGGAADAPAGIYSSTLPVPEGAYRLTYVSNAALNAVGTDADYVQSQVSSGATFTVSSF